MSDPDDIQNPDGNVNFRDDNWHFLAFTMGIDGADKRFTVYVDGEELFTDTLTDNANETLASRMTSGSAGVLAFGIDLGDTRRQYLGLMDEISFINRALTTGEVGALYTAAQVPEPSTVALLGLAVAGLALRRRLGLSK